MDDALSPIEDVWAKVDYRKNYLLQKTNVVFTVWSRTDMEPGFVVTWDRNDYIVQNVAQIDLNYTSIECSLPAGLMPPP